MATLPTFQDLYGGLTNAVAYYDGLFDRGSLTDLDVERSLHLSFSKIEMVFVSLDLMWWVKIRLEMSMSNVLWLLKPIV